MAVMAERNNYNNNETFSGNSILLKSKKKIIINYTIFVILVALIVFACLSLKNAYQEQIIFTFVSLLAGMYPLYVVCNSIEKTDILIEGSHIKFLTKRGFFQKEAKTEKINLYSIEVRETSNAYFIYYDDFKVKQISKNHFGKKELNILISSFNKYTTIKIENCCNLVRPFSAEGVISVSGVSIFLFISIVFLINDCVATSSFSILSVINTILNFSFVASMAFVVRFSAPVVITEDELIYVNPDKKAKVKVCYVKYEDLKRIIFEKRPISQGADVKILRFISKSGKEQESMFKLGEKQIDTIGNAIKEKCENLGNSQFEYTNLVKLEKLPDEKIPPDEKFKKCFLFGYLCLFSSLILIGIMALVHQYLSGFFVKTVVLISFLIMILSFPFWFIGFHFHQKTKIRRMEQIAKMNQQLSEGERLKK